MKVNIILGDNTTTITKKDDKTTNQYPTGISGVTEVSELNQVLTTINEDTIDIRDTSMSGIDLKSRLAQPQIPYIIAFDTLIAMKVFPKKSLMLTRQLKRLNVSIDGLGRKEMVQVVAGQREHEENKGGMGQKFKNFFGVNK